VTREEFDVWIGSNRKRLIKVAWRCVGKAGAEDIVQEVIVAVLTNKNYERLDVSRNPIAFLTRIITRKGYHRRRGLRREQVAFRELAYHKKSTGAGGIQGRSSRRRPEGAE
jgi:DNA-directed RNA polymerase specialized sigma24 family protein